MRKNWRIAFVLGLAAIYLSAFAGTANWICFDPQYPEDYIDTRSVVRIGKELVRFWERAGKDSVNGHTYGKFPTYTLSEMNCKTHMYRDLRWEIAMEAGNSPEALKARADFAKSTAAIQAYPGSWESIDPSPHSYSRLDFVCQTRE